MRSKKTSTRYEVHDKSGDLVALHERVEDATGGKQFYWRQPDGKTGLNGTPTADLPLYGVHKLNDDALVVVVVEGEKARDALADALADAPVSVVGTVTGAGGTPSTETLEVLRGHEVVLWPDADEPGIKHMARIADGLQGIAALVRVYRHETAEKGDDAADHPAVKSGDELLAGNLVKSLCGALPYTPPEPEPTVETGTVSGLAGRVKIGERIVKGVEPPEMLTPRLYAGKTHAVNSEPGEGKSLYALYEALQVIRQNKPVLYLDAENGPGTTTERLDDMRVNPELLDSHFHYYPMPDVTLDPDALAALTATLDEVDPALVIFDSLPDFLAQCGLNENDAGDVTQFMVNLPQMIRNRGGASLLLDHVTKSAEGRGRYARGSGAKLAKVDVSWQLAQTAPFDREHVGSLQLTLRKDREAYLSPRHTFSVGGTLDGTLLFKPSEGTLEETGGDGLTDGARVALDALASLYSRTGQGVKYGEWFNAAALPKTTFRRARTALVEGAFCEERNGRYYPKPLVKGPQGFGPKNSPENGANGTGPKNPENGQNPRKNAGPLDGWPQDGPNGPNAMGPQGPPPYRGGPNGPNEGKQKNNPVEVQL